MNAQEILLVNLLQIFNLAAHQFLKCHCHFYGTHNRHVLDMMV